MTVTIYNELQQGTDEWLEARRGILTASQMGKMLTPTLKVADNETSRTLINTLAAERITGHVEYVHPTFDMQRGTDDEPFARDAYAAHQDVTVDEIGFAVLETNGHRLGYSPDGLVGVDGLIEIKSRKPHAHLALLVNGGIPHMHMAQMQTGMYVMGREWCDYVGYSGGLPLHLEHVRRDSFWADAIERAHAAFEERITNVIQRYEAATEGLPMTERRPEFEEVTLKL